MSLVELAGQDTRLHRVAGREWHGPCPLCGGRDRFRVEADQTGEHFGCRRCGVAGGRRLLYGADTVAGRGTAILVEGELDALLLHQEAGDLAGGSLREWVRGVVAGEAAS